ncbi:hypothetical protein CsatB_002082 [Cannabis sativa]
MMRRNMRVNSSNNSKSYEYLQKAHNHNKVGKQFEIENDTERPLSILSYESKTRAPTHALLNHHHHRYIEKNKRINYQLETQSLTPSSLFRQECYLKKTTLAAKSACANSSFAATKFEIKGESKKRPREVFESARIEKEIEEREKREGEKLQRQKERQEKEEREKRANLQRLIREREAHLAMIEKVKQEVDHSDQNHKYFLELEKLCGYKQSCRYNRRNSEMHTYSSSNILFGMPLKKLGLFLKNDEEKEFEEEEENLNLQN